VNIRESGWSAGQGSGTGEKSRGATRSESGGNGAARFRLLGIGFGNGRGKVESGAVCRWLAGWLVGRSVGWMVGRVAGLDRSVEVRVFGASRARFHPGASDGRARARARSIHAFGRSWRDQREM